MGSEMCIRDRSSTSSSSILFLLTATETSLHPSSPARPPHHHEQLEHHIVASDTSFDGSLHHNINAGKVCDNKLRQSRPRQAHLSRCFDSRLTLSRAQFGCCRLTSRKSSITQLLPHITRFGVRASTGLAQHSCFTMVRTADGDEVMVSTQPQGVLLNPN